MLRTLENKRVLIVEDEPFIALQMRMSVQSHGGVVAGVAASFDAGMDMAETLAIDVALLDLNLEARDSLPIADVLAARGIPFVFATGCGRSLALRKRWPDVLVLEKPVRSETVIQSLAIAA